MLLRLLTKLQKISLNLECRTILAVMCISVELQFIDLLGFFSILWDWNWVKTVS